MAWEDVAAALKFGNPNDPDEVVRLLANRYTLINKPLSTGQVCC